MNNFEQFTLIIGALAIVAEALGHAKDKLRQWFNTQKH